MGERACSLHATLLVAALSAVSLLVLSTLVLSVLMASGALQGLSGCPTCGASAGEQLVSLGQEGECEKRLCSRIS